MDINSKLALSVRHLGKTYKNGVKALEDVSFDVHAGDMFALLGPNGAGKSTAIGIIASFVTPSAGHIEIGGDNLSTHPFAAKMHLGIVPQEINLNIFETPLQIMVQQAAYYGLTKKESMPRVEMLLKEMDLWHKKDEISRSLSGGMKRRLMIARGLVHDPDILILDEPTAGVDVEIRKSMWHFIEKLNKKGLTVVLTTHYLEEAEQLCNQVAIIDKGRIVENTTMPALLKTLDQETLILYLKAPLDEAPVLSWPIRLIDSETLEIDIMSDQDLTCIFAELNKKGVVVKGMRNKANRLEQLFINRVAKREDVS